MSFTLVAGSSCGKPEHINWNWRHFAVAGLAFYAILIKECGADPSEERRFSPPVVLSEQVRVITGAPVLTITETPRA